LIWCRRRLSKIIVIVDPHERFTPMFSTSRNSVIAIAGIVWILLVGVGAWTLYAYESSASPSLAPLGYWPSRSRLRQSGGFTLVMAVHPHCPCTRASIDELARLMTECPDLSARLIFLKPESCSESWVKTPLWQCASRIPRVQPVVDDKGLEARMFHQSVSGEIALYGPTGRLVFHGGITAARGHAGDSPEHDAIVAIVRNAQQRPMVEAPVFGCSLVDPACKSEVNDARVGHFSVARVN